MTGTIVKTLLQTMNRASQELVAPVTIAIARVTEREVVANPGEYRRDLGEKPKWKKVVGAEACVWLLSGTPEDVEKARAHCDERDGADGWKVIVMPVTTADPLAFAKEMVLDASKWGGFDKMRKVDATRWG